MNANVCSYDDYAKHARMMTEIHARPKDSVAGGAGLAVTAVDEKKDKAAAKPADKKRSLKRL